MSAELRKANAALRAQIREMQSRAAAAGIPLPSGGVDLGTGERVPQFKVLGLEFGDVTPYQERYDDLIEAKTNLGAEIAAYNKQQEAAALAESEARFKALVDAAAGPSGQELAERDIAYRLATRDMDIEDLQRASNIAVNQAVRQQAALMPLSQLAGRLAMERALEGSQRFLAFKQSQPDAIQNRMATAGATQANLQRATADQARAAAVMVGQGGMRRFG